MSIWYSRRSKEKKRITLGARGETAWFTATFRYDVRSLLRAAERALRLFLKCCRRA